MVAFGVMVFLSILYALAKLIRKNSTDRLISTAVEHDKPSEQILLANIDVRQLYWATRSAIDEMARHKLAQSHIYIASSR